MTLRRLLLGLGLLSGAAFFASAGEREEEKQKALSWNFDAVLDMISTPRRNSVEWNFEAALPVEIDLGVLAGLDDLYLYAHPTVVWGAEEEHQWNFRLYQAWLSYDHSEHWNLLAGLYDVGWHFHSLPSTSTFTRLPGQNTGSFTPGSLGLLDPFPLSSPAIRLEVKPGGRFSLQTAALLLEREHGLGQHALAPGLESAERLLLIGELNWRLEGTEENRQHHLQTGLGGWILPRARLENSVHTPFGLYAFADARLYSERQDTDQGCSGFLSLSAAAQRPSTWEKRLAAGFAWTGLLPHRDSDESAVALITEDAGEPNFDAHGDRRWRSSVEALHRIDLGEHAYLQAVLRWHRPYSGEERPDTWRVGLTLGLHF